MKTILKYLGTIVLLALVASFTFCSMGIYQGFQTANRLFAGADNYTCREFVYDLEHPETDKFAPLVIATIAYGTNPEGKTEEQLRTEITDKGMEPAVRKVYALCSGKPSERVLNLFTATIASATTVVSGTLVTSTTVQ